MTEQNTGWQPEDLRKLACDAVKHLKEEREALQARCDKLEAAAMDVLAHLVATVSVIERSEESGDHPSCAYGSDVMYSLAMKDFHKSIEAGRSALSPKENEDE